MDPMHEWGAGRYMAPELFRGEACSLESDVYAFAVTLWELFSGDTPFAGCSQIAEIKDKARPLLLSPAPTYQSLSAVPRHGPSPASRPLIAVPCSRPAPT